MKRKLSLLFLMSISFGVAQTVIGNINSGGVSNQNYMHAVGEIFVLPVDEAETNSGILGILYQVELSTLSVDEVLTTGDLRAYPNPAKNKLFFEFDVMQIPQKVQIYNLQGKLVSEQKIVNKNIDITALSTGSYIVKFDISNIPSIKIIKQ